MADKIRLAELLGTFSFASDLGRGQPMGHVLRTCRIAVRLAERLGLAREIEDIYHTALLVHAGCTAGSAEFAAFLAGDELQAQKDFCLCRPQTLADQLACLRANAAPGKPPLVRALRMVRMMATGTAVAREIDQGCSEVGARIAGRLGMSAATQAGLFNICETWNGQGPHGRRGTDVPLPTRIVNAAMILEVFAADRGPQAASAAAVARKGRSFDPEVVDAVVALCDDGSFWAPMDDDELWDEVLGLEPRPWRYVGESRLDDLALAFADLVDLKSSRVLARSRRASALAEAMAKRLRLPDDQVVLTRRAALAQDTGLVAVSSYLLNAERPLTQAEIERVRLHPYYTERILSRTELTRPIGRIAAMHHERLDGSGYHQGLAGNQIPMPARILISVNAFLDLAGESSDEGEIEAALQSLAPLSGRTLDGDCYHALAAEHGRVRSARPGPSRDLDALTRREIDVLRLIAQGASIKDSAARLSLSRHTVRHHLESVYSKIGVTSRAGATLYAVEHNLLG